MKRLMGRTARVRRRSTLLLRGEVFVDLFRVVRQGVRVSTESYSLKKIERLYLPRPRRRDHRRRLEHRRLRVVARHRRPADPRRDRRLQPRRLRVDVAAARLARGPSRRRRAAFERPRACKSGAPSDAQLAAEEEVADLADALDRRRPRGSRAAAPRSSTRAGCWRSCSRGTAARPSPTGGRTSTGWRCPTDELLDDTDSIGGLTCTGVVEQVKASTVHSLPVPARAGAQAEGRAHADRPAHRQAGGHHRPPRRRRRRGRTSSAHRRARHRTPPRCSPRSRSTASAMRGALQRLGEHVLEHGIDSARCGGERPRDLLLRRPPDGGAARRAPRAGPTRFGQDLHRRPDDRRPRRRGQDRRRDRAEPQGDRQPARRGRRRGGRARCEVAILQKAGEGDACDDPRIEHQRQRPRGDAPPSASRASVVGGTPWLWARPGCAGALDVLVVDEAGQLSLADVVAIGGSTAQHRPARRSAAAGAAVEGHPSRRCRASRRSSTCSATHATIPESAACSSTRRSACTRTSARSSPSCSTKAVCRRTRPATPARRRRAVGARHRPAVVGRAARGNRVTSDEEVAEVVAARRTRCSVRARPTATASTAA